MAVTWNGAAVLAKVQAAAGQGIDVGTKAVEAEAVRLIREGPKTGVVYTWIGTSKNDPARAFLVRAPQGHRFWAKLRPTPHQASDAGEAPANDSGALIASIDSEVDRNKLLSSVSAAGLIPLFLEYGTRYMEPRPFMRVAAINKAKEIQAGVADEIAKALGSGRVQLLQAAE